MIRYRPGEDVGPLDPWPMDNPDSHYVIRKGNPRTFGRLDQGGPGQTTRAGIWRCTAGVFDCTEQGDELMTVLEGHCRITDHATGQVQEAGPGETLLLRDGSRVTWEVTKDVTKVFFGHKPGGY